MISFIYLLGTIFFIGQNTGEIIKIIYGSIILKHLYTIFSISIISLWILSLLLSFYILVLRIYIFTQEYKGNTNHYFYNFHLYFLIHFIPYAIGITSFSTLFIYYLSTILEYTNINKDNIIFSIIFSICTFLVESRFVYNNHKARIHRQTAVEPLTELNSVIIINYSSYYTEVDISNTNTNCTICLEELNKCVKLKCNHTYHKECIDTWFKTNNNNTKSCPLCRQ
jgi:hypothetical protein